MSLVEILVIITITVYGVGLLRRGFKNIEGTTWRELEWWGSILDISSASIILVGVCLLLFSSCAILEKLDFPDDVHERIENQGATTMSKDINFAR